MRANFYLCGPELGGKCQCWLSVRWKSSCRGQPLNSREISCMWRGVNFQSAFLRTVTNAHLPTKYTLMRMYCSIKHRCWFSRSRRRQPKINLLLFATSPTTTWSDLPAGESVFIVLRYKSYVNRKKSCAEVVPSLHPRLLCEKLCYFLAKNDKDWWGYLVRYRKDRKRLLTLPMGHLETKNGYQANENGACILHSLGWLFCALRYAITHWLPRPWWRMLEVVQLQKGILFFYTVFPVMKAAIWFCFQKKKSKDW